MTTHASLYVNLSVLSLPTSNGFYTGLGFKQNQELSDRKTASFDISPHVNLLLHQSDKFTQLLPKDRYTIDPRKATEVVLCIPVEGVRKAEEILDKVRLGGGKADVSEPLSVEDGRRMRTFADPDGHLWGLGWFEPPAQA